MLEPPDIHSIGWYLQRIARSVEAHLFPADRCPKPGYLVLQSVDRVAWFVVRPQSVDDMVCGEQSISVERKKCEQRKLLGPVEPNPSLVLAQLHGTQQRDPHGGPPGDLRLRAHQA
jgi:hypothetical protein